MLFNLFNYLYPVLIFTIHLSDKTYSPTILFRIVYKASKNIKTKINKKIRDCGFLNKFRKGVIITSNNPIKLLIKNRG